MSAVSSHEYGLSVARNLKGLEISEESGNLR